MSGCRVKVYTLHGYWNSRDTDGSILFDVSDDTIPLQKKLKQIMETKASEFIKAVEPVDEVKEDWYYEIVDADGNYAKFYITQQECWLSESNMLEISQKQEKINRTEEIRKCLTEIVKHCNVESWKYEYMKDNDAVFERILKRVATEGSKMSLNATIKCAVREAVINLVLDDEKLEYLWEQFGDVLIDDDECILDDFLGFSAGTHREEVFRWFDSRYSGGVGALMFPK